MEHLGPGTISRLYLELCVLFEYVAAHGIHRSYVGSYMGRFGSSSKPPLIGELAVGT